jgi:hypothetical protein
MVKVFVVECLSNVGLWMRMDTRRAAAVLPATPRARSLSLSIVCRRPSILADMRLGAALSLSRYLLSASMQAIFVSREAIY